MGDHAGCFSGKECRWAVWWCLPMTSARENSPLSDCCSTIDSVVIKGKSGWATLGGDYPQDLLPKPVEEYVRTWY